VRLLSDAEVGGPCAVSMRLAAGESSNLQRPSVAESTRRGHRSFAQATHGLGTNASRPQASRQAGSPPIQDGRDSSKRERTNGDGAPLLVGRPPLIKLICAQAPPRPARIGQRPLRSRIIHESTVYRAWNGAGAAPGGALHQEIVHRILVPSSREWRKQKRTSF
jgi:hypothetical protein